MQAPVESGFARWPIEVALLQRWLPVFSSNELVARLRERGGFAVLAIVAWEVQSQIATMALISLLVLTSPWLAFAVMLTWSLVAAVTYYKARQMGLPDLLKMPVSEPGAKRPSPMQMFFAVPMTLGKVWLSGIQPFIYSRTLCRVLHLTGTGLRQRAAKVAVLGIGLTLFGVTANHHMLERAGLSGGTLLRLSMIGAAMNVVYRVAFSAFVVGVMTGLVNRILA